MFMVRILISASPTPVTSKTSLAVEQSFADLVIYHRLVRKLFSELTQKGRSSQAVYRQLGLPPSPKRLLHRVRQCANSRQTKHREIVSEMAVKHFTECVLKLAEVL